VEASRTSRPRGFTERCRRRAGCCSSVSGKA
jgi:hypothetical protein